MMKSLNVLDLVTLFACTCAVDALSGWPHVASIGHNLMLDPEYRKDPELGYHKFEVSTTNDPDTSIWSLSKDSRTSDAALCSATPCGAEFWSAGAYNNETGFRQVLVFEPHFFGSSRIAVKVNDIHEDEAAYGLQAWLETRGVIFPAPLEFSCPNFSLHKDRLKERPFAIVQIAAFAEDGIETYGSVEKYEEEQSNHPNAISWTDMVERNIPSNGRIIMASKSFSHMSMFEPEKTCIAVLTGHVVETQLKVNEKTGQSFYWALLDTLHGQMDVVVDPNCLKHYNCNPPKVGGVISGSFWLSGRIMNGEQLE